MNTSVTSRLAVQVPQQVENLAAHRYVEGRDRLIEHQHVGLGCQCAGDAETLALAAGQLMRQAIEDRRVEIHRSQQAFGALPGGRLLPSFLLRHRFCQGRVDSEARIEGLGAVLENHLQPAPAATPGVSTQRREVDAAMDHAALVGTQVADQAFA